MKTTIGFDSDWTEKGRRSIKHASTSSSRRGVIPGRSTYSTADAQLQRCDDCGGMWHGGERGRHSVVVLPGGKQINCVGAEVKP